MTIAKEEQCWAEGCRNKKSVYIKFNNKKVQVCTTHVYLDGIHTEKCTCRRCIKLQRKKSEKMMKSIKERNSN